MTTITTGTSGPQAWKIALVAGAVGLAALVVVNLPQTGTDTTDPQATEVSQAVTAENPQTRSYLDEYPSVGRTPAPADAVAGFEYGNESTTGRAVSPGVTTQYSGNSGELMPFENGQAPAQGFLDGPSAGVQGAQRVDPRAAAAAGLSPGAIDAVVGGTTQVAPSPDNLADAQARAAADTQPQAQAFAASDEALVNPVPEVNAAPYLGGTSDDSLVISTTEVNPADIKFLGTSTQPAGTERTPQQNVSMR